MTFCKQNKKKEKKINKEIVVFGCLLSFYKTLSVCEKAWRDQRK